ncbi:relaxase/mobilization nuclease domain-containing protein [Nostoc sp. UCD121]|uniref:relaxase/mobilization nuclease domain-containing protein n=1 Tax=unclassified Nostoc TaxID=2593658 RepID=UPI001626C0DA|nr:MULTISPECIES: relaxase/mobilization nuclease domain-containing protein [unclassified Nostoc]MBC1225245.1 relaxase/mobilization nuclease domain-containing protein [Nostoc sp. UCD120]MBC1281195.1 relaxase/mobilization nuclease domain-containing protein [Nostoc sp. UCD121]
MIGKQTKGRGFRKLLDYLESREDAKLIGGNMSGRNARELAREFKLSRQLNSDADRVVYHVSLSAAKDDKLDDEKWSEIGSRYMKEMGFDANQFVIFRHHNTDDDHIHIAASRIRMDTGLVVHDSWDYVRSEKVLRQIEQDYELVQVQGSREKLNRTPSTGQIRRIRREQEEFSQGQRDSPPQRIIKEEVQQTIDRAGVDNPQMPTLIMRLQQAGISVRTGFTRNGKSKGISYEKDGQAFSGTQLGAAYTFPGLQKHRGVDYQPERDDEPIHELLLKPAKPLPIEQLEKFLQEIERKQQPQFTPPPEDKVVWQVLHKYLDEKRYIPDYIVQGLHNNQLLYMDEQRNILFIKRDLDGEKTGALVWSKPRENHRTVEYDQNTSTQKGWFYLRLGGQPTDKVENVFLCSTPIDAMSAATYLISSCKGLPPTRTMLIVADDPNNLPMEFLKGFNRVVVAFNNDELGNKAASAVLELLPQGKRLKTHNPDWSQELEAHLREEQEKLLQQDRGFSR